MSLLAPFALVSGVVFAELTMPPGPFPHADAIRTLAETHAVALVASARCPDLFASTEIDQLQGKLGLADSDSPETFDLEKKLAEGMNARVDKVGAREWCDDVYGRFGPNGSMMKGLLKRCDPDAASC